MDFLPIESLQECMTTTKQLRQWRLDADATENCDLLELERQILFAVIRYENRLTNCKPLLNHSTYPDANSFSCPFKSCQRRQKPFTKLGLAGHIKSVAVCNDFHYLNIFLDPSMLNHSSHHRMNDTICIH
jgi:hypothetical protein